MSESVAQEKTTFGLWVYLMSDLISFAALFATYAVLRTSTYGGPPGGEIFKLPAALAETLILLTSSFTMGLGMLEVQAGRARRAIAWFGATFLLGVSFLALELNEFMALAAEGNGPRRSAFLSSFYALVGTHGLHISVGLLWMIVAVALLKKRGITVVTAGKLQRLSLFWHFLDVVWIFIFTIVYLMAHVA